MLKAVQKMNLRGVSVSIITQHQTAEEAHPVLIKAKLFVNQSFLLGL